MFFKFVPLGCGWGRHCCRIAKSYSGSIRLMSVPCFLK
ncbi:unnamed protein product [Tenebrio molitor]|nr:unnamed protein product [Tenebrio molitor]